MIQFKASKENLETITSFNETNPQNETYDEIGSGHTSDNLSPISI